MSEFLINLLIRLAKPVGKLLRSLYRKVNPISKKFIAKHEKSLGYEFCLSYKLPDTTSEVIANYFKEGYACLEKGKYQPAETYFRNAISETRRAGGNDELYEIMLGWHGVSRLKQKEYAAAEEDFDKMLSINSQSYGGYYNRGRARAAQGKYKEALADYKLAIGIDEYGFHCYLYRCYAKLKLGYYKSASDDYKKAAELSNKHLDADSGHLFHLVRQMLETREAANLGQVGPEKMGKPQADEER